MVREPRPREPPQRPREPTPRARDVASGARLPGSLRSYLAILGFFSIGNSSDAFLLLRARDLGVPIGSLPLLWSALHVSKLVSSYAGGAIADRIARSKDIVGCWIVYPITYLPLGFATATTQT